MKSAIRFTFAAVCFCALSASAQSFGSWGIGSSDNHTTLTIKPAGSCVVTSESVQPRKATELQVRSWERFAKARENAEDEDAVAPPPPAADQKPLSDDELAKKIREMHSKRFDTDEEIEQKIETLEVTTNSVRMVTSRSFGSLRELLGESPWSWGPSQLMIENARFEMDTNGLLRITFTPSQGGERYAKSVARQWKSGKTKFEWKLVLPGKVVSSGLPETRDNATSVSLDSEKQASIDAVLKIIGTPIVVTAQPGGIKLDEALESKKLYGAGRRDSRTEPDLPITDAGPGFVAEPVGVTVTTIYYFPEGEKNAKDRPAYDYGMQTTGTVVSAKLFPPKGRTIRSVSGVRVVKAKDDKGRSIVGAASGNAEDEVSSVETMMFDSGNSDKSGVARLDLRLGLPAGDAQTIEELEAEGVVLSIGGWNEMTLTNVQVDAKKEIDLGEVLPGAKLIITKVTSKKPQTIVQAQLEGPPAVNQLDVKLKTTQRNAQSHLSERRTTTAGGKTKRSITVQGYEFDMERGNAASPPPTLIVRFPQDSKRERVRFKLTALDLL